MYNIYIFEIGLNNLKDLPLGEKKYRRFVIGFDFIF